MFSKVLHLSLRDKEMIFNCNFLKGNPIGKRRRREFSFFGALRNSFISWDLYLPLHLLGGLPWCLRWYKISCNAGDLGSVPELGRSPGIGNDNPCQYSCLKNRIDRGAWQAWGSMGSQREQRDRHDWATNTFASLSFTCIFQTFSKKNKKVIYYQVIKNRGVKGRGIEVNGLNVIKPWKIH